MNQMSDFYADVVQLLYGYAGLCLLLAFSVWFHKPPKCCGVPMEDLGGYGFDMGNSYRCGVCGRPDHIKARDYKGRY